MRVLYIFPTLLALLLFNACKKHKENKIEPDREYVKYVNTTSVLTDLVTLDMVRTSDNGYLILGSSPSLTKSYHTIYLLKIDKEGNYLWDGYLPETYINPISEIIIKDGAYYLFCMDVTAGTHLIRFSDQALKTESVKYFEEILLPLHASPTPDGGYLVLNANLSDKWSGITKIASDFKISWSEQYYFNENFAAEIDRHLKREGLPLSFATGSLQNGSAFYFNSFSDANFSTVFVNPLNGKADGFNIIGGDRAYAAIKTILSLGEDKFAISRYDRNGNTFLIPNASIAIKSSTFIASTELGGIKLPDMEVNTRIQCRRINLSGKEVIIYCANTKNKGIGLYAFDVSTGAFLGSKAYNLETPLELGVFSFSSDGGILILGKTYIANRFPRVCIFKIDPEQAGKIAGF